MFLHNSFYISCTFRFADYTPVSGKNEEQNFEYKDIETGVAQDYTIFLKADNDYRVISAVFQSDSTMDDLTIEIDGSPVTWSDDSVSVDVAASPAKTEVVAKANYDNLLAKGSELKICTSGIDGMAEELRGSIRLLKL